LHLLGQPNVYLTLVNHSAAGPAGVAGTLHVGVVSAENMPQMDLVGSADPYCVSILKKHLVV
jgi:hypothetical protein